MGTVSINDVEHCGRNLWKYCGKYYRLFATGKTDNGCWLIAPEMRELIDIDVATANDIYGHSTLSFDGIVGTVPSCYEFVRRML